MLRRNLCHLTAAAGSASSLAQYYGKSFTVSQRTWQRIVEKNREEGFTNDARFLRLAIDSGGCHGYLYKFSFEPTSSLDAEEDVLVRESDVALAEGEGTGEQPPPQVVVDKVSIGKLEKAVLDYHSELKGAAFVVVGNELVDQSCACALSFSVKKKGKGGSRESADSAFLKGSTSSSGTAIRRGVA